MPDNTSTPSTTLAKLPAAEIMAHQPATIEDAENLLDIIFDRPYFTAKPEGQKAKLYAHLQDNGLPDPQSYTVFAISHNGSETDFDLKCLLLMGMIRLAEMEGDLTERDVQFFIRNVTEIYCHTGLAEANGETTAPGEIRIP